MYLLKKKILVTLLCMLTIPTAVYSIVSAHTIEPQTYVDKHKSANLNVTTATLTSGSYFPLIRAYAEVTSEEVLSLTGQVSGTVLWKSPNFKIGRIVKKDEPLLKIEKSSYKAVLANAEKSLADAYLALLQEQRKHKRAAKEWHKSGLTEHPSPLVLREPQLEIAKARYNASKEAVHEAKINLARTEYTAPFDAVVTEVLVTNGSYITPGLKIGQMMATQSAEIDVFLPENEWEQLPSELGEASVLIRSQLNNKHTWHAEAAMLSEFVEPTTRMRKLKLRVKSPLNKAPPLFFGSYVEVEIKGKHYLNSFVVPSSSLTADGYIWHVQNDKLQRFQPRILFQSTGQLGIEQGKLGNVISIVTTPLTQYVNGMKVTQTNRNSEMEND
ncbi:efflux RND transporter periplasmic adaptor subunit [Vibrio europaeus]|uniref:efflux RND transporter periplasmic adaptor subunit n=1 Tax=Vibrio europaeus TaxID=300876 RepID=UPI0039DF33D8